MAGAGAEAAGAAVGAGAAATGSGAAGAACGASACERDRTIEKEREKKRERGEREGGTRRLCQRSMARMVRGMLRRHHHQAPPEHGHTPSGRQRLLVEGQLADSGHTNAPCRAACPGGLRLRAPCTQPPALVVYGPLHRARSLQLTVATKLAKAATSSSSSHLKSTAVILYDDKRVDKFLLISSGPPHVRAADQTKSNCPRAINLSCWTAPART